jgi:fermentation-respiration switch protein FrsA (DUF1100 family)
VVRLLFLVSFALGGLAYGPSPAAGAGAPSPGQETAPAAGGFVRRAAAFPSDGETLRGWLYLPAGLQPGQRVPGIVTANALTGVKEINLPTYAERFAASGFATVIFDYRYWGESSGEPRYHIAPMEFRTDISAALTFLADQPEVDPDRVGGWGISMGGQHMLFQATWEPRFRAVVATATGVNNPSDMPPLSPDAARARYDELMAAARAERDGRATADIRVLEAWCPAPRDGCVLPVKEAYDFYEDARQTFAPTFENKLTSTSFQNLLADDSTFAIQHATAPILIVHPDRDVVSVDNVLFYFKRAPEPKRLVIPGGLHTSTYVNGSNVDMAAAEAIAWFRRYL